ncbi:hypothetical protein HYPSUDRAFT_61236 [Hypholoma sublateritium FD-334 SS-4]|uniref:Peptidase C14 caspase domain-containing protein n=1 Tax=Hypholoma sublateritium (strain FD-334 SS-4) TaxID=945553 RepID=A0A0D2MYQ7_HYPSF|nr:hypothetical protein HYPSUDRAFT_61236 [Hypholoma sublateritium FD-334 SS-4]
MLSMGTQNKKIHFFALLIGINKYNSHSGTTTSTRGARPSPLSPPIFLDLLGAVPDAKAFEKYLLDTLKVDPSHITLLLDHEATRGKIIDAFQKLASNNDIKEGDSIFIFYAGHGAQASPAERLAILPGCPEHVEVLIPYDYNKDLATHERTGIPDYTLAALLDKIATKKGDNITVVFDCCHSASALRGAPAYDPDSETITRAGPELQYAIPNDLDEDIWGGTRAMTTHRKLKNTGSNPYVFFSACKSNELAREISRQGCFTGALLALLKDLGPGVTSESCSQVIKRLQEKIDGSSYKSPYTTVYFRLTLTGKILTLKGGSAHGFCEGDQLAVYKNGSEDPQASSVATVEITKVFIDTSHLKLLPSNSTFSIKDHPDAAALRIKTARHYLKVHVDQKELALRVKALKLCALTDTYADAHIALSIDNGAGKQLRFEVKDRDLLRKGLTFKPRFIDDTDDDLRHVMKGLSHYYHHLKRTSDTLNDSIDKISVSFYEVQDTRRGHPRVIKIDGAEDMCKDNVIDITVSPSEPGGEGQMYGFEVINNTDCGILYPVLLYFDNTDFTITRSYPHTVQGEDAEASWPAKGKSMTIGYGTGGGSGITPFGFNVNKGYDMEAGFFKLFLFEKPVDLQNVVQEESLFTRSRGMVKVTLPPLIEESTARWGSITITVIQRRGRYPSS